MVISLFEDVKLTANPDPGRYSYSGYCVSFDVRGTFSLRNNGYGKIVVIFGADMSSSVHLIIKGKDILILGKGPKQGLNDSTLTAEAEYSINFTKQKYKFSLSLPAGQYWSPGCVEDVP